MRAIGILLLIAGAVLAFVYPSIQVNRSGQEIAKYRAFDRTIGQSTNGWKSHQVRLTTDMAPLRIRLNGKSVDGVTFATNNLVFLVGLSGEQGSAFSENIDISIYNSNTDSEGGIRNDRVKESLFKVSNEFGIVDNGLYTLTITPQANAGGLVEYLDVIVVSKVQDSSAQLQPIGFALLGMGLVFFVIGRARKKRKQKAAKKPKYKWGRQEEDK
ncbi:MAG: hypothetical protein AB8B49_09920 [Nitratireductor sp.]